MKIIDFGVAKAAQRIHETQVAKINIEDRAGQAPTIAPPARARGAGRDDPTAKLPRPSEDLPGDDELMRGIRGPGSKIADAPNGTELYAVADDGAAGHAILAGEGLGEMTILLSEEPAPLGPLSMPSGGIRAMTVATTIPRAKVYRTVGAGPRAILQGVEVTEAVELLVMAEGHASERVLVSPNDWHRDSEGVPSATSRVTLQPLVE